jgi:putative ABC transport system permease protein
MDFVSTEYSTFSLYGLKPLAGRLPANIAGGDQSRIVINQTAVARLGFTSPEAAIGHPVPLRSQGPSANTTVGVIAAVIPDFALYSIESAIKPTIYLNAPAPRRGGGIMHVLLRRSATQATMDTIDRLWKTTGNHGPIDRQFLSEHVRDLYINLRRNGQLLAVFTVVAVFLAGLGLVGTAKSSAERRTKEIGIRKAMGASTIAIVRLLLFQFARPVLWAILFAWPVAAWAMHRWLAGFAYHVPLDPSLFIGAALLALLVALITVAGQAVLVARQKAVTALRYE